MHFWSQNLNERNGQVVGSMLFNGRAHVSRTPYHGVTLGAEWLLFHKVGWDCGFSFETGHSDSDDGFMVVFKLPWLFALYLYIDGICRVKQAREFRFSIYERSVRFALWSRVMETNSKDPWWIKGVSWDFPWSHVWVYTKVLSHDGKQVVWEESHKNRKKFFDVYDERKAIEESVSVIYPFHYVLKNGTVQGRTAKVFISERAWGFKWWRRPVFVRRSIDVAFSDEVGERTGSWKGGTVGCGYDMLPNETAEQCLRRMERERKF